MSTDSPSTPNDASSGDESDPRVLHREIRAAKVSVDRTGHGVTMTVTAGKLRLRFYIEAQWSELIRKISAGEGELGQFVPFRMAPFTIDEGAEIVSMRTIDAQTIPGLSRDNPLFGTPLWDASFPKEDRDDPPE